MTLPLHGRRICITRSLTQASNLATRLECLGATTILLPTIEIAPPISYSALDAAILNAHTFDWLLFTSANAVEAFARRAHHLGVLPQIARVAAIGPATAGALHTASLRPLIRPVLIPAVAVAESLAASMLPEVQQLLATETTARLLLVRAEQARNVLPDTLIAAGATVTVAPAYSNIVPAASVSMLPQLFAASSHIPDAITFTSSSTANNLATLLAAASLTLPPSICRLSIGPVTSATLRELGLPPHHEATAATIDSLLEVTLRALTSSLG